MLFMTDREKREQKIRLMVEIDELQEEVNAKREKASAYADRARQLADWIGAIVKGAPAPLKFNPLQDAQIQIDFSDLAKIQAVLDEITQLDTRLRELQQRLDRVK